MKAKKIIIPVLVIAGIAVIGTGVAVLSNSASKVVYSDTVQIRVNDLEDKISVNGTIESSEKKNVYAKLNYPVESVNVSVGDTVKKGDVLCTIDTEELRQQILQQQASADSSGVNSEYSLSEAEKRYNEALEEYNSGENTAVLNALKALEQAEKNYNDALEKFENGENSLIMNADKAVEQAEKNLEEAKRQESFGKDTTLPSNIRNADSTLESARLAYENSKKIYEDAEKALKPENYPADLKVVKEKLDEAKKNLSDVENGMYIPEKEHAISGLTKARDKYYNMNSGREQYSEQDIEKITKEYNDAQVTYDTVMEKYDPDNLKEQIKNLQTQIDSAVETLESSRDNAKVNMDNAKLNYDSALAGYDSVVKQNDDAEENYSVSVKNAESALESARKDRELAVRQAKEELDSLKDTVDQQKENYDIAVRQAGSELASLKKAAEQQRTVSGLNDPQVIILENLKEKLEYAVVTAPCDGVVTSVNTEEGAIASGKLFTIENLGDLKVTAYVGEYDIPYVKEGMNTVIKCDALRDIEFSGRVTDVAKTPADMVSQSGTVYKIEVSMDGGSEKLLSGMTAKLNIISEKKENVLTVTYEALTYDENGNDAVYIAEKGEDGVYRARLVTVEIGLETDYETEIISDELKEGMYVLTDTAAVIDGSEVMINGSEEQTE